MMASVKGILKYSIYIFIAGWMFVLGIMVGRGNAPVSFDTKSFQQRLERIAGEFGQEGEAKKQIDLEFYKVLDQPVAEEKTVPKPAASQKPSAAPSSSVTDAPEVKESTKKKTFQKKVSPPRPDKAAKSSAPAGSPPASPADGKKGLYTIQVAAYKDNKDAVVHMALLEKMGIAAYRQTGEKDGVTWYRVRTGSFSTLDEARKYKEQLIKKKIKAMIIKKDNHEDI